MHKQFHKQATNKQANDALSNREKNRLAKKSSAMNFRQQKSELTESQMGFDIDFKK